MNKPRALINAILAGLAGGIAAWQSLGPDAPITLNSLGLPVLVTTMANLIGLFQDKQQPIREEHKKFPR
jgi:hypothetical protein